MLKHIKKLKNPKSKKPHSLKQLNILVWNKEYLADERPSSLPLERAYEGNTAESHSLAHFFQFSVQRKSPPSSVSPFTPGQLLSTSLLFTPREMEECGWQYVNHHSCRRVTESP